MDFRQFSQLVKSAIDGFDMPHGAIVGASPKPAHSDLNYGHVQTLIRLGTDGTNAKE